MPLLEEMFVTGRRRERPYLVSVHGLPTFCEKLSLLLSSERWEVPYRSPFTAAGLAARFNDLRKADLVYTWGGRITYGKFTRLARLLGKKKLIMLWCGSDILFAQQQSMMSFFLPRSRASRVNLP